MQKKNKFKILYALILMDRVLLYLRKVLLCATVPIKNEKYVVNILYIGYRTNSHIIYYWIECESHLN